MNQLKLWLFMMIFYLSIISWMMNNWISIWLIMEILVLFMMGFMSLGNNYDGSSLMMKFYIIQLLISLFFLFSALVSVMNLMLKSNLVCMILLLAKLGFFPFHFWVISVLGKMDWYGFFMLSSFIKLPSLSLIYYLLELTNLTIIIFSSILVGSCLGFNNMVVQKLLGYSSLSHLCWLILSLQVSFNLYWLYFMFYILMMLILILMFFYLNIFYLNQMKVSLFSKFYSFAVFFSILSLAGFPPFMGFLMKWILGSFMIFYSMKSMVFFMFLFSFLSVGFYLQLFYYFILVLSSNLKLWSGFVNSNFVMLMLFLVFSFYLALYLL